MCRIAQEIFVIFRVLNKEKRENVPTNLRFNNRQMYYSVGIFSIEYICYMDQNLIYSIRFYRLLFPSFRMVTIHSTLFGFKQNEDCN